MIKNICLLSLAFVVLLIANFSIYGQESNKPDEAEDEIGTISIDTKTVSFELRARDSKGQLMSKLEAKDFLVYEDGQRQEISHFSKVESPINLVMVIDTSGSLSQHRETILSAVKNFIDNLNPYDQVALLQFKDRPILLADFSSNREKMLFALVNLGDPVIETDGNTYFSGEGSAVYDALSSAVKLLEKVEGRKAILFFSDWLDTGSFTNFDAVKRKLVTSESSLYVIKLENQKEMETYLSQGGGFNTKQFQKYFKRFPCKDCIGVGDGKTIFNCEDCLEGLNQLPKEKLFEINRGLYTITQEEISLLISQAGGRSISIANLEDLDTQYAVVLEELHTLYSVAYYPEQANPQANWHKIEVKTKLPNVSLFHKKGYSTKNP